MKQLEMTTEMLERFSESEMYMIDITDFDETRKNLAYFPVIIEESSSDVSVCVPSLELDSGQIHIMGICTLKQDNRMQDELAFLRWLKENIHALPDYKPFLDLLENKYALKLAAKNGVVVNN